MGGSKVLVQLSLSRPSAGWVSTGRDFAAAVRHTEASAHETAKSGIQCSLAAALWLSAKERWAV